MEQGRQSKDYMSQADKEKSDPAFGRLPTSSLCNYIPDDGEKHPISKGEEP